MMTNAYTVTHKTPFARWLFEHDVTVREGARLFKTNRNTLSRIANGHEAARGETRDLIARVLFGETTITELRQASLPMPAAGSSVCHGAGGKLASGCGAGKSAAAPGVLSPEGGA